MEILERVCSFASLSDAAKMKLNLVVVPLGSSPPKPMEEIGVW